MDTVNIENPITASYRKVLPNSVDIEKEYIDLKISSCTNISNIIEVLNETDMNNNEYNIMENIQGNRNKKENIKKDKNTQIKIDGNLSIDKFCQNSVNEKYTCNKNVEHTINVNGIRDSNMNVKEKLNDNRNIGDLNYKNDIKGKANVEFNNNDDVKLNYNSKKNRDMITIVGNDEKIIEKVGNNHIYEGNYKNSIHKIDTNNRESNLIVKENLNDNRNIRDLNYKNDINGKANVEFNNNDDVKLNYNSKKNRDMITIVGNDEKIIEKVGNNHIYEGNYKNSIHKIDTNNRESNLIVKENLNDNRNIRDLNYKNDIHGKANVEFNNNDDVKLNYNSKKNRDMITIVGNDLTENIEVNGKVNITGICNQSIVENYTCNENVEKNYNTSNNREIETNVGNNYIQKYYIKGNGIYLENIKGNYLNTTNINSIYIKELKLKNSKLKTDCISNFKDIIELSNATYELRPIKINDNDCLVYVKK